MHANIRTLAGWLASIEIWVILFLVSLSFIWSPALWVAVCVGVVFALLRWISLGRITRRTPADWGIACLIAVTIFSGIATRTWYENHTQYLRLGTGIVIFYAIVNWEQVRDRINTGILGVILVASGLCIFAAIGVEWAVDKFPLLPRVLYDNFLRLVADTANPNVIAGSLVLLMPVLFAVIVFPREYVNRADRTIRWLAGIVFIVSCLVLVLSLSRGAWMAGLLSVLLVISLRWKWGWLVVPLAGAAIWLVDTSLGREPLIEILLSTRTLASLDDRISLWARAIQISRIFAFTGTGMGSFSHVVEVLYPLTLTQAGKFGHAHNLYLQITTDLGLPGLVAWLSVWISLSAVSLNLYIRGRSVEYPKLTALGAGMLGSQLGLAVHGILDVVTWGMVRPAPIVWAIWGVIAWLAAIYLHPGFTGKIHTDVSDTITRK
jgi:putative inorganic carbon (HCO3(-)) transporter